MQLIEFPQAVPIDEYHTAIALVANRLMENAKCLAVYQVGGLSSPGISDIDLVAVYQDESACDDNPLGCLAKSHQYLFPHPVFATSKTLFEESQRCVFFHNYRHLRGEDLLSTITTSTPKDVASVRQSANEYLVRMYVNHLVERTFGVCKVRNLLLNAKALLYDVEFLQIKDERLVGLIQQVIDWRVRWFESRPTDCEIKYWHGEFWESLDAFLRLHFASNDFFLPSGIHRIGRSIEIRQGNSFQGAYRGVTLPWMPARYARRLMSALHRVGKFTVQIPYEHGDKVPASIANSFDYVRRARTHNERNLPAFMPLTTSLTLQA